MNLHGIAGPWLAAHVTARRVAALRISLLLLTAALVLAGCALLQAPAVGWWLGGLLAAALGLSACGGSSGGGGGGGGSSTSPATVLNLGTLVSGGLIARLEGAASGDEAGYAVSSAGNFDGSGGADLLIGAPGGDAPSWNGVGKAYVVWGGDLAGGQSLETLTSSGTTGIRVYHNDCQASDFGFAVGLVGDTGTYESSIIIGAPADEGYLGTAYTGAAFVVEGNTTSDVEVESSGAFWVANGEASQPQVAPAVAGIGSIDNNSDMDVLVGQPGKDKAYIYVGENTVYSHNFSSNPGYGAELVGAASSETGAAVAAAGNFDGSGSTTADMVVGAPGANSDTGEAYVLLGAGGTGGYGDSCGATGFSSISVEPSLLDDGPGTRRGFKISGVTAGDRLGAAVAGVGDFNADGKDDILIGAPAGGAGKAYVIYGKADTSDISLSSLTASQGFAINGETSGDEFGTAVAGGDLNNDGRPELIIGAPSAGGTGKVYVIFGGQSVGASGSVNVADLTATEGVVLTGETSGDKVGFAVAAAGDADSDSIGDLLIGAPGRSSDTGAAYLVYGPELQ